MDGAASRLAWAVRRLVVTNLNDMGMKVVGDAVCPEQEVSVPLRQSPLYALGEGFN